MANTINFDEDFIGEDDLRLLKIKHAIFNKLRVRFSELAGNNGRAAISGQHAELSAAPAKLSHTI
jgi:hypothetical protein